MKLWAVSEGNAKDLTGWTQAQVDRSYNRDRYGFDWVTVEAISPREAIRQAGLWDGNSHPAQTEMEMFSAAYRAAAVDLLREVCSV
jgi:hypothetical protein